MMLAATCGGIGGSVTGAVGAVVTETAKEAEKVVE